MIHDLLEHRPDRQAVVPAECGREADDIRMWAYGWCVIDGMRMRDGGAKMRQNVQVSVHSLINCDSTMASNGDSRGRHGMVSFIDYDSFDGTRDKLVESASEKGSGQGLPGSDCAGRGPINTL